MPLTKCPNYGLIERWGGHINGMNRAEIAELFGVSTNTVTAWISKGCPVEQEGGRGVSYVLDPAKVMKWQIEQKTVREEDLNLQQERAALARAQRIKTELETMVRRSELVEASAVTATWQGMVGNMKSRLLGIPIGAAPKLAKESTPDGCRKIIEDMIRDCLTELADDGLGSDEPLPPRDGGTPEAAAKAEGEPVGRHRTKAKPRGKRKAG